MSAVEVIGWAAIGAAALTVAACLPAFVWRIAEPTANAVDRLKARLRRTPKETP